MVLMKFLSVLLALTVAAPAFADEITIFDVRKNLAMSDTEKVYRDFYINGGSEAGLSAGMIVTVERRMPLYDNYQNRSAGDLQLKVAKIKIIHVQKGISVARLHSEFTRENAPLLEDNFIMVGDRLDMNSATSEKDAKKAESEGGSEPVASSPSPKPEAAQIVVNTVKVSSEAPVPNPEPPTPNPVETPILQ
jgi:hypothetical protein